MSRHDILDHIDDRIHKISSCPKNQKQRVLKESAEDLKMIRKRVSKLLTYLNKLELSSPSSHNEENYNEN